MIGNRIFTFAMVIVFIYLHSISAERISADTYGSLEKDESGSGICQAHEEGWYVTCGFQQDPNQGETNAQIYLTKVQDSGEDGIEIKSHSIIHRPNPYDGNGNYRYKAMSIKKISGGNYIVCGWEKMNEAAIDLRPFILKLNGNLQKVGYNWFHYDANQELKRAIDVIETSDGGFILVGETDDGAGFILKTRANLRYMWHVNLKSKLDLPKSLTYSVIERKTSSRYYRYYYITGRAQPENDGNNQVMFLKIRECGYSYWYQRVCDIDVNFYDYKPFDDCGICIRQYTANPDTFLVAGYQSENEEYDHAFLLIKIDKYLEWDDNSQFDFWSHNENSIFSDILKSIEPLEDGSIVIAGHFDNDHPTYMDAYIARIDNTFSSFIFRDTWDIDNNDDAFYCKLSTVATVQENTLKCYFSGTTEYLDSPYKQIMVMKHTSDY